MIEGRIAERPRSFAARLAAKARLLAEARAESRWRAHRADPWRWRAARLLWPLF